MPSKINREKIKAFLLRRKLNAYGLLVITAVSAVITLLCALAGFARTNLLVIITILLVLLCFVQAFKMRRSFRTIHTFKGHRRKNKHRKSDAAECK
ncbi:MAG: hypothetical protein Q4F18_00160 [Clostridia bacterium]|nr:hypothetical protein [Clostridia bacterium]